MKLELSHDLLAREIYHSMTRSAPELVQLKQKEQYIRAQYAYYREGNRSFLTREEVEELTPFLPLADVAADERQFVEDSRRQLRRKRRIRNGLIALVAMMLLAGSATVLYYAYRAQLSDVRAQEAAAYSESNRLSNLSQQEMARGNRHNALLLAWHGAQASDPPLPLIQHALADAFHLGFQRIPLLIARLSHDAEVKLARFSPDDRFVVSIGEDRAARLWDVQGRPLAILEHGDQIIHDAVFDPDGRTLYTGAADGSIIAWDTSGNQVLSFRFDGEVIHLGATGQHLTAVGFDHSLAVYDLSGRVVFERPAPNDDRRWAVQFSPAGDQLLLADLSGDLQLLDLEGNVLRRGQFADPVDAARYTFRFLADGSIQVASPEAAGWIWRPDGQVRPLRSGASLPPPAGQSTGNLLQETLRRQHPVFGDPIPEAIRFKHGLSNPEAQYSNTGRYLLSHSRGDAFYLWTLNSAPLQAQWLSRTGADDRASFPYPIADSLRHLLDIDWILWSPNGRRLFSSSLYQSKLWDSGFSLIAQWPALSGLRKVSFSDDGALLWMTYALGDGSGGLSVRDTTGRERLKLHFPGDGVTEVAWAPQKETCVVLLNSGRALLYSLSRQEALRQRETGGSVSTAVFSKDGQMLFLGYGDGRVGLWNLATDSIRTLLRHDNNVFDLDIHEETERILSGSGDFSARLSDLTGALIKEINMSAYVENVGFSPSGAHYFVRDRNHELVLMSADGQDSLVLSQVNDILGAVFLEDNRRLVLHERTGSKEQLRLVDVQGQNLATYPYPSPLTSMAASADGRRLFGSGTASAHIWLTPAGVMNWLREHSLVPLSPQEEKLYGIGRKL